MIFFFWSVFERGVVRPSSLMVNLFLPFFFFYCGKIYIRFTILLFSLVNFVLYILRLYYYLELLYHPDELICLLLWHIFLHFLFIFLTLLTLMSTLSNSLVTPPSFWLMFAWCIYFQSICGLIFKRCFKKKKKKVFLVKSFISRTSFIMESWCQIQAQSECPWLVVPIRGKE